MTSLNTSGGTSASDSGESSSARAPAPLVPAAARVGLHGPTVERLWDAFQSNAKGMYWSRVWAIYVLIRWCHHHDVFV